MLREFVALLYERAGHYAGHYTQVIMPNGYIVALKLGICLVPHY